MNFVSDIRFAVRTLRKSPGFAMVAILSLALGIGANTAIFSLIDAVLLRMLPVDHPEQLVFVRTSSQNIGNIQVSQTISNAALEELEKLCTRVSGLAAYSIAPRLNVGFSGRSELASGHFVWGSYQSVLGVQSMLGRSIVPADNRPDGRVAVISYGYWQRRFGGDPRILGTEITINHVPFTIAGVTPREFYGLSADTPAEVMMPIATRPQVDASAISSRPLNPNGGSGTVIARLKSGVSSTEAAAEITAVFRQILTGAAGGKLTDERRAAISKTGIELSPASQGLSRARNRFSKPLEILMVVVGLVMLIACANIANLLLARAAGRQREIAIRLSLGSSRGRLIRQLLTESLLLSFLGGAVGLLFAVWAREGIIFLAGANVISTEWNVRVIGFTTAICVLNAILFGIAPALRATRGDFVEALKTGRTGRAAGRIPLGRILVAGQVAISLALLVGAMLLLGTFRNLDRVDPGFARDRTLLVTIDPTLSGYQGPRGVQIFHQVLDGVSAIPGVRSATLIRNKVLTGDFNLNSLWVPGYTPRTGEERDMTWVVNYGVGPHYFTTSEMRLAAGRDFTEQDREGTPEVAVINENMARHFFASKNPIGQRIGWERGKDSVEIVGVVKNVKYFSLRDDPQQDIVFTPFFQQGAKAGTVLVRTAADPTAIASSVRAAIREIDATLPVYDVTTMDRVIGANLVQERLLAILSGFFGVLALGLCAIGLYGVLSYGVSQRTSEIGLRMALGARPGSILALILGETGRLLAIGIVLGVAIALASTRWIASVLYGVTPTDAFSISVAVAILAGVAMIAGFLPARRAARVDPMVALRNE